MPAPVITLALSAGRFVVVNGSRSLFNELNRGVYFIRVYLRQPNPTFQPGQEDTVAFDATGYDGLRFGLWQDNPGEDATQLALTDQTGFTYNTDDPDNPCFEGWFSTDTAEITEWLDGECHDDCFLAISLVSGAEVIPVLTNTCDANFTIYAQVDPGSGIGVDMVPRVPRIPLPCQFEQDGIVYLARIIPGTPNLLEISEI